MNLVRIVRLSLLLAAVAISSTGCRGCMRENLVYEHTFNRPDCGPVARPCPPLIPEFEAPPLGAYGQPSAPVRHGVRQKGYAAGELRDEVADK